MNQEAKDVWIMTFGNKQEAHDYAGRKVKKNAYNNRSSQFGWNVDHIRPVSEGGKDILCNKVACHILTNDEKGDDFPHWEANNQRWKAMRVKGKKDCYKIVADH